jgi:Ras GTPase-activating protein 1
LVCPAIVSPERYGLSVVAPSTQARRTLVLIAKTLQNVANAEMNAETFFVKEPYMRVMAGILDT